MNIVEWREILLDRDISKTAKLVGLVLSTYYREGKETFPNQDTIAEKSSIHSLNTVRIAIKELIDNGLLSTSKKKKPGESNDRIFYTFTDVTKTRTHSKFEPQNEHQNNIEIARAIAPAIARAIDGAGIEHEVEEVEEVEEREGKELNKFNSFVCVEEENTHTDFEKFLEEGRKQKPTYSETHWKESYTKMVNLNYQGTLDGWIKQEKPWPGEEEIKPPPEKLEGEELKVQLVAIANWKRGRGRRLSSQEAALLEEWEKEKGKVNFGSVEEWKKQHAMAPP